MQVNFGFDNFYQCNYEIWGTKGKITALRAFTAGPEYEPKIIVEKQDECKEYLMPADNHFINMLGNFYNSIIDKEFHSQYKQALEQA